MGKEQRSLPWVTPPKIVGPGIVVVFSIAAAVVAMFVLNGNTNGAIITLLCAICFLLIGIADLLGELIMISAKRVQPPEAAEQPPAS